MQTIKNIIFDFGNVLFDLDLSASERALKQLMGDKMEPARAKLQESGVFKLYETGGLSTEEFVDALRLATDLPLTVEQVVQAWNSIFISMPGERFDMLLRLRQQYKVFLLSNINALHADWIDDYMQREHRLDDFQSLYFDGVYYSHLVRLRKPDLDIYEYVLADAEIKAEQSIFIDDLEPNIQAARDVGMQGIVKTPDLDIMAVMEGFLK